MNALKKLMKEKIAHLEQQNKLHINKLTPEDIARQLLIAKFTFKAFGTAEDLIEVSEFTKADSILKGQVILCGEYHRVLIGTLKRAMLLESLKKKNKGSQVFTEAMNMFYPLDTDWADRNAEAFIQECPYTIKSILGFILQNKTDDISGFVWPEVRALLTTKCGDRRSKIKSALEKDKKDTEKARMLSLNFTVDEEEVTKCSGDQEFEILNEINAHDDDEAEEAIGLASKVKTYEDEQDDNDHYQSDGSITEIDEDDQFSKRSAASNDIQINKTISQKHKLISIGCLSSLTKSKKNKKQ